MNSIRMKAATAAMMLAAGSAVTLGAWQNSTTNRPASSTNQPNTTTTNPQDRMNQPRTGMNTGAYATDYRSASKIKGTEIATWNNEEAGTVDDLVIDRGSGQITHVVVKSGSLLGLGGRSVLIPYREFQWDPSKGRLMLGTTDVGDFPAFTYDSWKSMRTSTRPAANDRTNWYRPDSTRGDRSNMGNRNDSSDRSTTDNNRNTGNRSGNDHTNRPADEPRAQNTGDGATNSPTNRDPAGASTGQRTNTGTGVSSNSSTSGSGVANTGGNDQPRAQNTGEGATNSPTNRDARGASPQQQWARGSTEEPPPLNDWMWDQSRSSSYDPYGSQWSQGSSQRIEGEIKRIDRQYTPNGEQVVLEIQTSDGKTQRVAVGPSWYVTGGDTTYSRGDRVTIDAMPMYIARSATVNGKEFKYRDDQGKPAWSSDSYTYGSTSYSTPSYRNLLLSELRGAKLDCRGSNCGKIDDVVLEMNSGTVAFLSIDPDQNFLGIADTKRLAPWSVASIGADGRVRLDAQKDMILTTTKTPDDITTLNRSGDVDTIYNAYQVPARDYDRWRDDENNYGYNRYNWQREREMWRRNQNYQDTNSNPNAKNNPTPTGSPQPPR